MGPQLKNRSTARCYNPSAAGIPFRPSQPTKVPKNQLERLPDPLKRFLKAPVPRFVGRHANIPLPVELRDETLFYLLTMPTTPTEYFLPLICRTEIRTALFSHEPLVTINPQEATVYKQYRALFCVSKAMQPDVNRLMLCLNEWLIHISYVRDIYRWRGSYQSRNGLIEMQQGFGLEALRFLRDVRVEFTSERREAEGKMREKLTALVNTLLSCASLRKVTVHWSNFYFIPSRLNGSERGIIINYIKRRALSLNGTRQIQPEIEDWKFWEVEEKILTPLLKLRNIPEVHIIGNVSKDWAEYLERVMMGKEKGCVEMFVRTMVGN